MKKISPGQYAEALYKAYQETRLEKDRRLVLERFFGLIERQGALSLLPQIAQELDRVAAKSEGGKHVVIETARASKSASKIKAAFSKNDYVEERLNPDLIAGVRIIIDGERLLDRSLSRRLSSFFTK